MSATPCDVSYPEVVSPCKLEMVILKQCTYHKNHSKCGWHLSTCVGFHLELLSKSLIRGCTVIQLQGFLPSKLWVQDRQTLEGE